MGNVWARLQGNKLIYLQGLIPVAVFLYLSLMCNQDYSWVFVSSDSGDWMACAVKWMVPQPYGAPVYIVLSRVVNFLFPSILPWAMAALLGALPTALTCYYTYLSVHYLTKANKRSTLIAIVGAILVAGSAVLVTQATVVEITPLSVTFATAAFYQYLLGHKYRVAILLALGIGVHVMIAPIALFWLAVEVAAAARSHDFIELKTWVKPTVVCIAITAALYGIIVLLMYLPTPRFMAGSLTVESLTAFWTKTSRAIIGQISIFETPGRLLLTLKLLLMSFGVALVPIWFAFKRPVPKSVFMLLGTIVFVMWYFITCLDVMTWTYIAFATPAIVTLACVGLSKLQAIHTKLVLVFACIMLLLNPIFLNANTLTEDSPKGRHLIEQIEALPSNAIVVTDPGSESLGLLYYVNSHPDSKLVPLMTSYLDNPDFYVLDYADYIEKTYHLGLDYSGTLKAVQSALDKGYAIYYTNYDDLSFERCFIMQGDDYVKKIVGLTGLKRRPVIEWRNADGTIEER